MARAPALRPRNTAPPPPEDTTVFWVSAEHANAIIAVLRAAGFALHSGKKSAADPEGSQTYIVRRTDHAIHAPCRPSRVREAPAVAYGVSAASLRSIDDAPLVLPGTPSLDVRVDDAAITPEDEVRAGLEAFFRVAAEWSLSLAEQQCLLAASETSVLRWRDGRIPHAHPDFLERLSRIVAIYLAMNDWMGDNAATAQLVRASRTAPPPDPRSALAAMLDGTMRALTSVQVYYQSLCDMVHE